MSDAEFCELLQQKGEELWRDMPWRADTRAYYVLVSELMLQQTQVTRVVPKFEAFVAQFPDEAALARASLADVLKLWQGLGYNRRAKYLHDAARMIVDRFDGKFPESETELLSLPGVGKNTAGAVRVYAFNQPSIFVETNVRTVYLHHFFADRRDVADAAIIARLEATIDQDNPRRFYQALMDYGSWLKANGGQNITRSRHYKKQSPLAGSVREMRGRIVRALTTASASDEQLRAIVQADARYDEALQGLIGDGLVTRHGDDIHLTNQ